MASKYRAPKGTYDLVYPDSDKREALVRLACDIMALYG
jgi:hypothetical protein